MLSEQQLLDRQTGLGASEIASVAGLSPWKSPFDVWLRKRRGADLSLPPYVVEAQDEVAADGRLTSTTVGSVLEEGIASLYAMRLGLDQTALATSGTRRHPEQGWALATPDRLVSATPTRGLEIKAVGGRLLDDWEIGPPDYVVCQVQWSLWVVGASVPDVAARWDVAALLGGTAFDTWIIERDQALIDDLVEIGARFWHDHVLADRAPEQTGTDAQTYADVRHPRAGEDVRVAPPEATMLVEALVEVLADAKRLEDEEKRIKAALCEIVGESRGIKGPWGSFSWPLQAGRVAWKQVAEALAPGGIVPTAVAEAHRSSAARVPHFTPKRVR